VQIILKLMIVAVITGLVHIRIRSKYPGEKIHVPSRGRAIITSRYVLPLGQLNDVSDDAIVTHYDVISPFTRRHHNKLEVFYSEGEHVIISLLDKMTACQQTTRIYTARRKLQLTRDRRRSQSALTHSVMTNR